MLELLEKDLAEAGIPYYKITGATPKEKRIHMVKAFNMDRTPVFLISKKGDRGRFFVSLVSLITM
ncbi:MAG: hypothetical protein IJI25_07480 [Eubacterium sp.]|nr:hypothetical protein [Eubacterium sp.]